MPKTPSIYRRLTGRQRGLLGYSQLWLAPDHILLVKSSRFAEHYQRFALADIQSIVVTGVRDNTLAQIAGAGAAILWTLLVLAVTSLFAKIFFGATGAIAIAFVIRDIARGPRCRCHLYTAVSRELLKPVSRLRTARKFLSELRPAIEAVQGTFAGGTIPALDLPYNTRSLDSPPEVPRPPNYLPEILFGLFLLNAALLLIDQRFPRAGIGSALITTIFAELALIVLALIRRPGRDPRRVIYGVMIAALFLIGWDAFEVGRSFVALVAEASRRGANFGVSPNFILWGQRRALIAAAWRIAAGTVGLIASYIER